MDLVPKRNGSSELTNEYIESPSFAMINHHTLSKVVDISIAGWALLY